jgi:hypothetical protein
LVRVKSFDEISFRKSTRTILHLGAKCCSHAACPVAVGVVKAVEISAGLVLPQDVVIKLTK